MGIPVKCILEMGNWPASTFMGKRVESRSIRCWVANGECSPRGKGISTRSTMSGRDDGGSSISEGTDRCSFVGGGGNGCSSTGGGGTVGKGLLSGEARGEMVSMSVGDSSIGDAGGSFISEGTVMVGSDMEGGFQARISSMEG
ncbi:hypothetical protein KI387_016176, partial [Taxus chinensis]